MIFDQFENRHLYPYGAAWQVAFDFLLSLNADAEEKRYTLQGDDIFAMVESYETQPPESKQPEAHRKYVDIQVLLAGAERIAWSATDELTISKPYEPDRDIAFFERSDPLGTMLKLEPGRFAVFFPGDAHTPGVQVDGPCYVKKAVVKIAVELLG